MQSTPCTRRTFSLLPLAALPALAINVPVYAQTPVTGQAGDTVALYQQLRDELLAAGRTMAGYFVTGDDEAFARQVEDPSLAAIVPTAELTWLESSRVRLRWRTGASGRNSPGDRSGDAGVRGTGVPPAGLGRRRDR